MDDKKQKCKFTFKTGDERFELGMFQSPRGIRGRSGNRPDSVIIDCHQEFNQVQLLRYIEYLRSLSCVMELAGHLEKEPARLPEENLEIHLADLQKMSSREFEKEYLINPITVMSDRKQKNEELREAVKPLIKYLCENYHPHVTAIVTPTGVEVLEGTQSVQDIDEFIVD